MPGTTPTRHRLQKNRLAQNPQRTTNLARHVRTLLPLALGKPEPLGEGRMQLPGWRWARKNRCWMKDFVVSLRTSVKEKYNRRYQRGHEWQSHWSYRGQVPKSLPRKPVQKAYGIAPPQRSSLTNRIINRLKGALGVATLIPFCLLVGCEHGPAPTPAGGVSVGDGTGSCTIFIVEHQGYKFAVAVGYNKCAIVQLKD